ncbi:MAG: DNA mismatch repair endonuclease MutL [Lewinellaceae bacterium]|nr:DNA mismatch repair endonuclease MutL [Lewinellaceae bacterium]
MSDIIHLLPDSIANQIAAGEVIQRPASVVKELLENALDAESTSIKLIIKDAGKTSIQVIDNGKGMSETDARMAFERHATSKIKQASDLFSIKTMGFRGEALASIAAIAHVDLITKLEDQDIGHQIHIEGSDVKAQTKVSTPTGTGITVKNVFYNVPARRKFLKSDPVEMRHILDEFHRVAIANPQVHFSLFHNDNEVYYLPIQSLKARIIGLFGKSMAEKLIPVEEQTDFVKISGFITKPEASKKTQGDQFIFVNNRFIKSNYLNHAVRSAYDELISKEYFPGYFLFLELDPASIDINVHPTKTEIKFEDERLIYNYLKVSLKHALGQYSILPMLDFDAPQSAFSGFERNSDSGQSIIKPSNFTPQHPTQKPSQGDIQSWNDLYGKMSVASQSEAERNISHLEKEHLHLSEEENLLVKDQSSYIPTQLHQSYITFPVRSGLMIIDQQAAHERILYEEFLEAFQTKSIATQRELFPINISLNPAKAEIMRVIMEKVNTLGFDIVDFGNDSFLVHGTPAHMDSNQNINTIIDEVIDQYGQNLELELGLEDNIARSMAMSSAIKRGKKLEPSEMSAIIDQLLACKMPTVSPTGRSTSITITLNELFRRFQ